MFGEGKSIFDGGQEQPNGRCRHQGLQLRIQYHALRQAVQSRADNDLFRHRVEILRLGVIWHRRLTGQQKARTHRNTIGAKTQSGNQTSAITKTPSSRQRHCHGVSHLRQQNGRRHLSGVPAALATLYDKCVRTQLHRFHCMFQGTHRRDTHNARGLEARDGGGVRRAAVTHRPNLFCNTDVDNLPGVGNIHMEVHAKGRFGLRPDGTDVRFDLSRTHHRARQKSESAGTTGRRHQVGVGNPAHRCLNHGVLASQ